MLAPLIQVSDSFVMKMIPCDSVWMRNLFPNHSESLGKTFRARQASPQSLGSDYMHSSPQDSLRNSFFYTGCLHAARYNKYLKHNEESVKLLDQHNAAYYTYTPSSKRPKSYIIKGILGDFSEKAILDEINSLKPQNIEIIRLDKFHFDKLCPERHHYLVEIIHDSPAGELLKIKNVANQKIRWESEETKYFSMQELPENRTRQWKLQVTFPMR